MVCKKCGAQVPDEAKFCPKCGARFDGEENLNNRPESSARSWWGDSAKSAPADGTSGSAGPDIMKDEPPVQGRPAGTTRVKKKSRLPMIIGIIIAAVVVLAVAFVLLFVVFDVFNVMKPSINLNKYLEITVNGYDGYGTAEASIDTDRLEEDYKGKIKLTEEGEENPDLSSYVDSDEDPVELILEGIGGKLSRSAGLSNGDEITFTWNVDQSLSKNLNVNLKYTSAEEKVNGLKDLKEANVFEGVNVDFSGVEPNGTATVNTEDSEYDIDASVFELDRPDGLSNGETVTVSISLETLAEEYGLEPEETTREFTVSGLPHYVLNADEIPGDMFEETVNWTEGKLDSALSEKWAAGEDGGDNGQGGPSRELESTNYLGCYFFANESEGNRLFLIYEVHAMQNKVENGQNELTEPVDYYWFAVYSNIVINEDGSCEINPEYNDAANFLENGGSFNLEYTYEQDGEKTGENYYSGFTDLYELGSSVYAALPGYTLTNDTTVNQEEEPAAEENN